MFEIYYTSAPEGLKRGSSGFCTVAATDGIPKAVLERLEALSAYRHHFAQGQGQVNPVSHAHWRLSAGGKEYHVLSRVCDSGVDHTHRTNAFAHHVALEASELPGAGPAAMLADKRVMSSSWDGRVGAITRAALPMVHDTPPGPCSAWAKATDDAGYAGLLLEAAIRTPNKPVCILFNPGQQILPLIEEVLALLPPPIRWNMTFNSYFTSMPSSAVCTWRCCLARTPAGDAAARAAAAGIILNLADPTKLPPLAQNAYTAAAKSGTPLSAGGSTATAAKSVAKKSPPKKPEPAAEEELQLQDEVDIAVGKFGADQDGPAHDPSAPIDLGFDPRAADVPTLESAPVMNDQAQGAMSSSRTAPIRNIEALLHHADSSAARAQKRRRNQLVLMGALAIILVAVVGGLIAMAMRGNPDDHPIAATQRQQPEAVPAPPPTEPKPVETVQAEPKPVENRPVIAAETRPVETKPVAIPVKAARTIVTAATLDDPRTKIDLTRIASSEYAQLFQFQNDDADDLRKTASLALLFPGDTLDYKYDTPTLSGVFTASPNPANKNPSIVIEWKDRHTLGQPTRLVIVTYLKAQSQLQVIWPSGVAVKNPEVVSTVYWILAQSTLLCIDASGNREKGQKVAFHPLAVPVVTLSENAAAFNPPATFPPGSRPAFTAPLPKGWTGTFFSEWENKDPAMQTADNQLWTAKMRFATSSSAIDAFFTFTVRPKLSAFTTDLYKRMASDDGDLQAGERELAAIQKQIDDATALAAPNIKRKEELVAIYEEKAKDPKANGMTQANADEYLRLAKLAVTQVKKKLSDDIAPLEKQKNEKLTLVAPQREAMEAYKNLDGIDVTIQLPNGLSVFTVRLRKK